MWQLRQDKYAGIKVNLVLVHCPLWYTFNQEAVANIILADVFARASFKNKDYDDGIRMQIADYNRFLKNGNDETATFGEILENSPENVYFE